MRAVVWVLVLCWAAAAVVRAAEHAHGGSTRSEALTDATSLSAVETKAAAKSKGKAKSGGRAGGNLAFDWNKLYKPGDPGRGPCCRICPNAFYAVPRVVPRPPPLPKGPTKREQRLLRFAAIFDRPEPRNPSEDYVLLEQQIAEAREADAKAGETEEDVVMLGFAESTHPWAKPRTAEELNDYPEWPLHEYTADPYQDAPIPEFTPQAALPGVNCCNVCASPGIGQIRYPQMLKWGESPATDDFPQPYWDLPCCKLCSAGCFSNGEHRPPGVPLRGPIGREIKREVDEAKREIHSMEEFLDPANFAPVAEPRFAANRTADAEGVERRAAVRHGEPTVLSETGARTQRRPRPLKARGNWPKQMDPPGANRPYVAREKSCAPMIGCCNMCYNHPMIYYHAPSGIW